MLITPSTSRNHPPRRHPPATTHLRPSSFVFRLPPAFTLIEVMVVIGIIVILAGIGVAVGVGVKHKADETATKATLDALRLAMNGYLSGHPEPPADKWLQALRSDPSVSGAIANLPGMPGQVLDGYGNPIQFIPSTDPRNVRKIAVFQSYGLNERDEVGVSDSVDIFKAVGN